MKKLISNLLIIFFITSCNNKNSNNSLNKINFEYKDKEVISVTDYDFLLDKDTENIYLFINDSIHLSILKTKNDLSSFYLNTKDSVYKGFIESQFSKKEVKNQFALLTEITLGKPVIIRYRDKDVFMIGSVDRLKYFIDNNIIELNNKTN
ncbi:hypothetical protein [Tenacibaculum skagerrakense]|uniref:hypothetical protein n=1 Tax=Tenacibaculum skagerrakense TaxID=186571 RepID=UPI00104F82CB|nr:hypothetical protein [Tenacibaculum skagerrakense]